MSRNYMINASSLLIEGILAEINCPMIKLAPKVLKKLFDSFTRSSSLF